MVWNTQLTNLRDVLSGLYETEIQARNVANQAQLTTRFVDFHGSITDIWHSILKEADRRNKVQAIIDVALEAYPDNDWLRLAKHGTLFALRGPDISKTVDWQGSRDSAQLEKIIGNKSTLLPIGFLETGLKKSKSVVRVVRSDGFSGSGFITPNNVLITNHHVIPSEPIAKSALVQFNYQLTPDGLDSPIEEYSLLPQTLFETTKDDDWTAVKVDKNPVEKWGGLDLTNQDPKVGDHVNVIQHPGGGPKQIALYHNTLVFADNKRLQYLTDTMPGSSGSPVFDDNWNIVGLHHSGGWLREPGSKEVYFRNEGIHINTILENLNEKGVSLNEM